MATKTAKSRYQHRMTNQKISVVYPDENICTYYGKRADALKRQDTLIGGNAPMDGPPRPSLWSSASNRQYARV